MIPGFDGALFSPELKDVLWDRLCGLGPDDALSNVNRLWNFREALIKAKVFDRLLNHLDRAISAAGYLPMSGQIVDATLVAVPNANTATGNKAAYRRRNIIQRMFGRLKNWNASQPDTIVLLSTNWPQSLSLLSESNGLNESLFNPAPA